MHVIERAHDRFQEGCSGCVVKSIGPMVRQIKRDPASFSAVTEMQSDFTGSGQPSFSSRCRHCKADAIAMPEGPRFTPLFPGFRRDRFPANRAVSGRTISRLGGSNFDEDSLLFQF